MVNKKMMGIICTALLIAAVSAAIASVFPDWCEQEVRDYFDVLSQNIDVKNIFRLPVLTDWKKIYKEILYIIR